jgi:hypothetical protein
VKLLGVKHFNPGDKKVIEKERIFQELRFEVFKFNNRPRPLSFKQILIICSFSEFGCEIVSSLYCIPKILRDNPGKYVVVVGWHGRDFLYRHLVDEFWEIKEEYMSFENMLQHFIINLIT